MKEKQSDGINACVQTVHAASHAVTLEIQSMMGLLALVGSHNPPETRERALRALAKGAIRARLDSALRDLCEEEEGLRQIAAQVVAEADEAARDLERRANKGFARGES